MPKTKQTLSSLLAKKDREAAAAFKAAEDRDNAILRQMRKIQRTNPRNLGREMKKLNELMRK